MFTNFKYSFLLFVIILNSCSTQKIQDNQVLVFKVEHKNSKYLESYSIAYSLLDLKKIKNFKLIDEDSIDSPNVTYNITANGGLFISESFTDIYTMGCCEYGDIEKAIILNFNNEITRNKLDEYSPVNELSLNKFQENLGTNFLLNEEGATYDITVWLVNLDYCKCEIYMESPKQVIYKNDIAYIKDIKSFSKLNQELRNEIKIILEKLMKLDIKNNNIP